MVVFTHVVVKLVTVVTENIMWGVHHSHVHAICYSSVHQNVVIQCHSSGGHQTSDPHLRLLEMTFTQGTPATKHKEDTGTLI